MRNSWGIVDEILWRAPSICSLITGTTISHSQRNKVCDNEITFGITIPKNVPIKYYKYVGFLTTLTKSKGGEMGVGDTSDTTSRDFVSRFKHSVRREQKLPRNSKKRRKGKSKPPDPPYTRRHPLHMGTPDPPLYEPHRPDFIVICRRFHELLLFFIARQ